MTKFVKKSEISSNWFEIDAKNAVVGRLASIISKIIRGKNKRTYSPHVDHGDFVVVKNIEKIKFTGKKFQNKKYYRHTGYPGGIKEITPEKLSEKKPNELVLGADSVIDLNKELISKPKDREEALKILKKLNGKTHYLISSVCISKNGSMIWNYTDKAALTMKDLTDKQLNEYLSKINDETLYAYNVYQIEGEGRSLFLKIEGDENTIMGLPIKKIKEYLNNI